MHLQEKFLVILLQNECAGRIFIYYLQCCPHKGGSVDVCYIVCSFISYLRLTIKKDKKKVDVIEYILWTITNWSLMLKYLL